MDAICPPSTVYAAYNRYPAPKQLQVWPYNGHESGATFQPPLNLRWLRSLFAG
jgi:cephalosporin-C deacetylase